MTPSVLMRYDKRLDKRRSLAAGDSPAMQLFHRISSGRQGMGTLVAGIKSGVCGIPEGSKQHNRWEDPASQDCDRCSQS